MTKLPTITGEELIAALEKAGFYIVRQKGSHVRMKHEYNRVVSIPYHSGKTIEKGLESSKKHNVQKLSLRAE